MGAAIPAARLGALSLLCHAGGTVIGGGDGTITLFDAACRDYAQTELQGGVVAMSFSPGRTEVRHVKSTGLSVFLPTALGQQHYVHTKLRLRGVWNLYLITLYRGFSRVAVMETQIHWAAEKTSQLCLPLLTRWPTMLFFSSPDDVKVL